MSIIPTVKKNHSIFRWQVYRADQRRKQVKLMNSCHENFPLCSGRHGLCSHAMQNKNRGIRETKTSTHLSFLISVNWVFGLNAMQSQKMETQDFQGIPSETTFSFDVWSLKALQCILCTISWQKNSWTDNIFYDNRFLRK